MLTKFWEGLGNKLAEKWIVTMLTPAFIFWSGGFLIVVYQLGWKTLEVWFNQYSENVKISILISSLLGIVLSGFIVNKLDLWVLRFLEGYHYPYWIRQPLAHWHLYGFRRPELSLQELRKKRRKVKVQNLDLPPDQLSRYLELQNEWEELPFIRLIQMQNQLDTLNDRETDQYIKLMSRLRYTPFRESQRMPTRLGNILRAAELRSSILYGLDAVICWPYLWLLLPDGIKKELIETRSELNVAAHIWLWSILFTGWSIWSWWAMVIGLLSALLVYRWMLSVAENYSAFVTASFDFYRKNIYEAMGWQKPDSLEDEKAAGEQLTQFILFGFAPKDSVFQSPERIIKAPNFNDSLD